uniref:Secreted protein n=1 Tax=Romanomermis culicivorax TaxID=13658 RepID=A0A915HZN3_ROMCU
MLACSKPPAWVVVVDGFRLILANFVIPCWFWKNTAGMRPAECSGPFQGLRAAKMQANARQWTAVGKGRQTGCPEIFS